MKPSAHRAHPEAELSDVMTTGMSAPPMDEVTWAPRKAEVRAPRPRSLRLSANGVAALANLAIAHRLKAKIRPLKKFFFGSDLGAEERIPWSLPKATREPVMVIQPRKLAR